ncbi:flagellar hook-associated protein FlgK [Magnetospirillum sulfuroxidans]|uniref:Flagellar hook-associated protein 1 n=1 Tax=Magnetospirillum sulfuroxidans TaxID=611300 RepID=A0ABS5IEH2_9PROT|nr:flagellar hook-associated protein FlgK [Magnetospirillum sulfuroxidans]MBR9972819.1 flagellar hook-associated protein FlgK [Magnetospirillum sulfuroxidans]
MSLTLGLNTALSGLLTSQRALDTIAQNVTNVNTKGYVRKVMNQESRVLNGNGAGVQVGSVTRMVNEGLLKDIRKQTATLGKLQAEQEYYPRIDDLFGNVADNTSIAHKMNDLYKAFELLGTQVNKPAIQWSTVQSGEDAAQLLDRMTEQLQGLRLEADRDIESTVNLINDKLASIHDLNQKIVKNSAVATGTTDLEDKRDLAITELASMIDIQYYKRQDGSMIVYTNSGEMLVDNQDQPLNYSANTKIDTWMTSSGGQFNKITVAGGSSDLGPLIQGGQLRALLDMRDKTVTDLQSNLDEMAVTMREALNLAHNRGTSYPNVSSRYEGTRTFAKQGNIAPTPTAPANPDTSARFMFGSTTLTTANYTNLTIAASGANPWQSVMTASAGTPFSGLSAGSTFSIDSAEDSTNNGTYRVISVGGAGANITVEKVNPRQTIQLSGTEDVSLAIFDSTGAQAYQTTLNAIMQTNYSGSYTSATAGTGRSLSDFAAKGDHDEWAINEVSAHVEGWLRSLGPEYANATANLNSEGKLIIDTGVPTQSLAFRDQVSSAGGAAATDATISFDVDGDGATDQTVKGFSNFFGLNDFYVNSAQNSIFDSAIQPSTFKTSTTRDLSILDGTGQLGPTISIPQGSSLEDIAKYINQFSRTTESASQSANSSFILTSAATISVSNGSGTVSTATVGPGAVSLEEIAGKLTTGSVVGSVVQDGNGYRLRLESTAGSELSVSFSGGAMTGGSLESALGMNKQQRLSASVIPEGSGYRLRVVNAENKEVYMASSLDVNGNNLLSEIGLQRAATRQAGTLSVRADLQTAPEKLGRGTVQWNSDLNKYYLSEGDNTTALSMAEAMNAKRTMNSAGGLYSGNYSLSEYAASTISLVAGDASHSADSLEYQQTLNQSLDFQYTSFSGVNLDEEVSSMIDFQQAYSATAKVITVLQEMLETLTNMIK